MGIHIIHRYIDNIPNGISFKMNTLAFYLVYHASHSKLESINGNLKHIVLWWTKKKDKKKEAFRSVSSVWKASESMPELAHRHTHSINGWQRRTENHWIFSQFPSFDIVRVFQCMRENNKYTVTLHFWHNTYNSYLSYQEVNGEERKRQKAEANWIMRECSWFHMENIRCAVCCTKDSTLVHCWHKYIHT